jgi:hypothetical protein
MAEETKAAETKPTDQPKEDSSALKAELETLRKERDSWTASQQTLNDKVKVQQEDKAKRDSDTKALESALTFNLTSSDFIKVNESILPEEISEIFSTAAKESYDSPIDRANATKAAIIQSFFSQQSNVDLLTDSQKVSLADYLKLTKNGKEQKARDIYDNLFEPSLGTLKRIKKAEELSRAKFGYREGSKGDSQYKEKLMSLSKKHYLGEKI